VNTDTTTRQQNALTRSGLCQAMESLDDVGRSLFELRVFEGKSHKEISDLGFHGMTPVEVRRAFSKAVEALRQTEAVQAALIKQASGQ